MSESISSSDLKQIIVIEGLSSTKNQDGILVDRWTEKIRTRAKVINLSDSEIDKDAGKQVQIQKEFTIRFNPKISIKYSDKINFNSIQFDITSVDNIDNSNKWLKIKGVCNGY